MQEYLKKITLPQPGGAPQELRVLTPEEVEAMLARSFFAAQDEYWSNATPEDKERILDTIVAEGLRLDDIWASIKWPSECMKYVDADTGELLPYSGDMPKFLPAFDFTGKSVAEIKAFFRYDMNEEGRRNVRVCGGLSGVIPEEIEFELLSTYSYFAPPYQGADYTTRYREPMLRLLHTGAVDITYGGYSLYGLSNFYYFSACITDLTIRLIQGESNIRGHFLQGITGHVPASVSASIYIQEGDTTIINYPFNNARELDLNIFGSPEIFGLCPYDDLKSLSLNPEFKPKYLVYPFGRNSSAPWSMTVNARIDCSKLLGENDLGYTNATIQGHLVLEGIGTEGNFKNLDASRIKNWAIEDVVETLTLLYDRHNWLVRNLAFNKNLEASIPAELIAEATAKGFTIIFK